MLCYWKVPCPQDNVSRLSLTPEGSCRQRRAVPGGGGSPPCLLSADAVILQSRSLLCLEGLSCHLHVAFHSLIHSLTHSLTHSFMHSFPPSSSHPFSPSSNHSFPHSFTPSFIHDCGTWRVECLGVSVWDPRYGGQVSFHGNTASLTCVLCGCFYSGRAVMSSDLLFSQCCTVPFPAPQRKGWQYSP